MSLSTLKDLKSWLMKTVPGSKPFDYHGFLYWDLCGQPNIKRQFVIDAGMESF
ncbi:uncharacterized protein SOCG_02622 [Schizosaccharomyces octosporus yFS286]|uniref:Uncharacterized protein n=1 Tax=Schizosaccharomyces octosporus (strain yFS286) TaxID=483514 RepID=S9PZK1_SCHOY|nr:uncharacterized protein SOCG_02622 [Schizosaccharomyces octosporus yFS286]EPX73397.1 hypothetical protein SOCG_02622 [Schizosaccharomyces octosporus yFS286]